MNTPSIIGGDYEELSDPLLKSVYQDYCGIANITDIECRVADTKILLRETGQIATCTLPLGLSCRDNEQDSSICKDYEIRVFCDCGPQLPIETTPIATTTVIAKLPPLCKQTGWTDWMSASLPNEEGESETLDNLRVKHSFCSENEIIKIECRSILSWRYIHGNDADVICNKKFGLLCKGQNCDDYELRVYCNCEIEETSPAPICVTGWTEYFNTDHPDHSEIGDDESLESIRQQHQFCVGGIIEDIECKTRDERGNLIDYSSLDTFGLKCSKNVGFVCNKYVVSGKCEDFMVRFYCRCEPVFMTTEVLTTETILAPTTVLPVPVECGWTPWLNIDSPESSPDDGDYEDLAKIQSIYKTCGGKDLIDIECRMSRTLHSYKESLQKKLVCDTMHGFQCKNEDQVGKCYDYEIRLLCMYEWCLPVASTVYTTAAWETTTNPCPIDQVYDECAYSCEHLCSSFAQNLSFECKNKSCIPGCRPITGCLFPNVWRDFHTCVSKDECTCMLIEEETVTVVAPKEVVVKDCEKCQCIHDDLICNKIPGCGAKLPPEPRIEKENILQPDCWTDWINVDRPWTGGGDLETLSNINQKFILCSDPVKAECRTVESKQKSTDTNQVLRCDEKGLICLNKDNIPEECHDYEIRFFCPCSTQVPEITTPAPTLPPGPCIFGWSDWFNSHTPNNRGDFETIQSSRTNHLFCSNDMISAIECRRVGHTVQEHLQQGVLCDLQVGLICSQESLNGDETCWDYEIRFFCDCPTIAPFTASKTQTTTALPTQTACSYWSEWINENHPTDMKGKGIKKGVKGAGSVRGDSEKVMLLRLQTEHNFCREGYLSDIECRESVSDLDYTETGDKKLTCNLVSGFRCKGKDQLNGFCKDYKIRYFCFCNEVSTTPVITQPITPQVNVAECETFYNIRDGPMPIPDSNIKASSSKDSNSGPQSSHLNSISNHKSAGAWIAGDINKQQWIEIDLGEIQPIYGVVTKGRNAFPSWVKSYKALYSRNGLAYAYISDQDSSEKVCFVFTGNYDSETPVQNLFRKPVEARFIRIQPISFYKEIAMRVDVLGCAEGLTTEFITTIATHPPCIDEMGLYSGLIHDFQIQTSSNRNPYSDGQFVRLNSLQTEEHSGAWVAEHLDENQYVQIDFLEPRILTGVKTQGRDMVPQWVTAFTVSYSQDGDTWIPITDSHGVKVFSGNYDSSTVAITYFPQAIRARFIRINPVNWENWIAMRLEILGCQEEVKNEAGTTRKPHVVPAKCIEPMGFENHQLPNTLITVSSSDGDESGASRIRLNTHKEGNAPGGWVPASYDYQPVVLIDFYGKRNLTGILTQGREDKDMWIMSYKVMYSLDNINWEYATDMETDNIVFSGNRDRNSIVLRLFSSMIQARYLKIIILDWHNLPAMRMEIWGCFIPYPTVEVPPTKPCVENSPWISLSDPAMSTFGDKELIKEILSAAGTCSNPFEIECRTVATRTDYTQTGQLVSCDLTHGLICENKLQSSSLCYNYEVRIKCWTCGIPTTAPISLCPEVPNLMKDYCPQACPEDYACDGSKCVPHVDCPCFNDGKTFNASNIIITNECHRCECILGGYSTCEPIKCPNCLPGQKLQMDDHCNCNCVSCAEGTILCPSNGICIKEEQWCDGIKDCADDETDCPTTPTVSTLSPTTTEHPAICNAEYELGTDNCEMTANLFETFDGLSYQYDICHHVLLAEYPQNLYSVEIHKTCLSSGLNCYKYLVIEVDSLTVKIGPGIEDVTVQDSKVLPSNFWLVSQRFQDFELKKRGNTVVFRSKKYHFDVSWDTQQNAKITVSKCSVGHIFGLCGLYNREMSDDRTMPNGELAISNEKFGNSWAIGSLEKCQPASCPPELLQKAIEVCSELREEPFNSSCTDFVKIENRIEACLLFICECEQRTIDARNLPDGNFDVSRDSFDLFSCKCQAYDGFVEACESKGNIIVPEWRIKYDCTPECPLGMEWQDCGPGCELTCDNYQQREQLCGTDCVPGCYCPSGLIRHHNRCVKPKMCQDCVCRGHGDPNYITFDGHYYAFQGNCTYILVQHQQADDQVMNFRILATNVECPEEPLTSCTDGLTILWNGHTIEKFRNKPIYLDSKQLNAEDSPVEHGGISIIFIPGKSTVVHIKEINLVVRYFDQMYGFNIELPAFFYFNKTEGLCGVCNFIESDDLYHRNGYVTENIEDFAYSWLEPPNTKEKCEFPREKVPEPPPGICNFTASSCELFLDPSLYARSCENDVTYSRKPESSMCRSKFQYSQQCCERGVSLVEWLLLSGCETSCPEDMVFDCTSACPKTCNNYKDYHVDDCDLMPLYTCTCPPGQVLKLGRCIDESKCEVCDNEGHVVGDEWSVGACKTCLCSADLNTICTVVECPEPPICDSKETLQKLSKSANSCCDAFICLPMAEKLCTNRELEACPTGEANVQTIIDGCPEYRCECMPELCPPIVVPLLEEGEEISLYTASCCPEYKTICKTENCHPPPLCAPGFRLSTFEGRCCNKYTCVPKKDICVYQHTYQVLNGSQIYLEPVDFFVKEYELGSSWHDGLCKECFCIDSDGQLTFTCREEICPDEKEFPDIESYVYVETRLPGICCPKFHRTSCLVNEKIYEIGEEWPSAAGDKCKSYQCVTDEKGEAIRLEKTTICDEICPENAIYVKASPESSKCCGICKAVACEENGILYEDGASWISATKPCFTATCTANENGTLISYRGESCPVMPDDCPPENVKTDPHGCCSYCKKSKVTCSVVQVPIYETRGYFSYVDTKKGTCTNEQVLPDLTKCSGTCATDSSYSNLVGDFQSVCNCCLPTLVEDRSILLDCTDGTQVEKIYKQPFSCQCSSCSGPGKKALLETLNQVEPY
ncbi:hemocytin-like [Uloborus diversus]|uniref:hemocytin-like n=1 Tax=Uloborus diversus TaxID=327109 RepID=UPI0024093853|nr:hemocytin-like [Uloborus diversus]